MPPFSLKFESTKLHKELTQGLKFLRTGSQLTMRQLGQRLNLQHAYVCKIERLDRRVSVGEFIHYCRAMKYDPARVLAKFLTTKKAAAFEQIALEKAQEKIDEKLKPFLPD